MVFCIFMRLTCVLDSSSLNL